ncbi:YcjX family protein [Gallibacterium melopsittaci]|uniref:YcjX family protein n=1 Tax=Gallibacterium melopsittaci TaxID=516063 RepID=A0ABV6HWE8_9PAST
MLKTLQNEIDSLIERGLDQTLRLAVTGLSQSGKTTFITGLINQLLSLNTTDKPQLPLFNAARNQQILGVKRLTQKDWTLPRFEYEENLLCLEKTPPQWPQSTRGLSETRLEIHYQHRQSFLRHIKEQGVLYLDIFDYPGEWLLDLPLLSQSYQQWSLTIQQSQQGKRQALAVNWLQQIKKLDLHATADEHILAQLAKAYTEYLHQCKAQGFYFIQPGRFILPGDAEGSIALQFFPLPHLSAEQWLALKKSATKQSYFRVLQQRYDFYRNHIVKQFYQQHFSHFDRQIILADCLTALNHSREAFIDMQFALRALFQSFHYGQRNFFNRLFSPKIDKLLFAATKADHITTEQIPNLISLLRQLVQADGEHLHFSNIDIDFTALAAIRATQQVIVEENGQQFKALQGIRSQDKKRITLFPGSVPQRLPTADFWQTNRFEFDQFDPQLAINGEPLPHLRLDAVLEYLLGDKLR